MSDLAGRMKKHANQAAPQSGRPVENAAPDTSKTESENRRERATQTWEERTRRATWHVDVELLDRLDLLAKRDGLSKSKLVRDALSAHLDSLGG